MQTMQGPLSHPCAAAYWNNEEGTRAAFAPGGWFRTGDLATVLASGYLQVVDRKKDMVRRGMGLGVNGLPQEAGCL